MSEESFQDRLKRIKREITESEEARIAKEREAQAATEAWAKGARVTARAVFEQITSDADILCSTLSDSGLQGWGVDKPDPRLQGQCDEDDLSLTLSCNRHGSPVRGGIRGVIALGLSVAQKERSLRLSVSSEAGLTGSTSTNKMTGPPRGNKVVTDLTNIAGMRGWYQEQLEECYRQLLVLAKCPSR